MGWDEVWQAVASAALVGTERQPFTVPTASGKLGQLLSQLGHQSPEAALLTTAATLSLHQKAGWVPKTYPVSAQEPCDRHDLPYCSPRATRLLQQMLQGHYSQLLPEWLTLVAKAGQRVPELHLPDLLNQGYKQRRLRPAILSVLGQRGRWLAAQNPDWNYAVFVSSETDWETGNQAARLLSVQEVRSRHPDRARELVQASWTQEAASDRAKFLEAFRPGLSMADEPFLEEVLGDRSKEVRRVAADLLASLPDSRLCQRMLKRIEPFVTFKRMAGQPSSFEVVLPDTCDAEMQRDGIELKPKSTMGERAWWLQQMISATPLVFWQQPASIKVAELINAAQRSEWKDVFKAGWRSAIQRQRDQNWAHAFLTCFRDKSNDELQSLLNILMPEQREDFLSRCIQTQTTNLKDSYVWTALLETAQLPDPWSYDFTHSVLFLITQYLPTVKASQNLKGNEFLIHLSVRDLLSHLPLCMPVDALSDATDLRSAAEETYLTEAVHQFLAVLQFRQDVQRAFMTDPASEQL